MSGTTEPTGYNHEEAAFKKQEMEQLAKMRSELDSKRKAAESAAAKSAHWMRCPKCGGQLAETKHGNVTIDQCGSCGGIYLDAGELDMLVKHEKAGHGVLSRILGR
jgi:hypothetical protein